MVNDSFKFSGVLAGAFYAVLLVAAFPSTDARAASGQNAGTAQAVHAVNFLGQRVLQHLDRQHGNTVLISPLNLGIAMAQLTEGARGKTRSDLLRLMGWRGDVSRETVGRSVNALLGATPCRSDAALQSANALWVDRNAQVNASFSSLEKQYFGATTRQIDFSDPDSVGVINAWVARQTHDLITRLVNRLDPMTQVMLTSALYFKGLWKRPFDPTKTKPGRFAGVDGRAFSVPFMHRSAPMSYLGKPDYQAVSLPLGGPGYVMVFVVPRGDASRLPDSVMQPGSPVYDSPLYDRREVHLALPRLRLSWKGGLLRTLKGMAALPFSNQADYGAISAGLTVGEVVHQVKLDLDEKGVTAAAGTAVALVPLAVGVRLQPPVTVRVDRPFDFYIQNRRTGAIVVIGHVVDPGTRARSSAGSNKK